MRKVFRYIIGNINLLNIMLIAAIVILANYAILPMLNKSVRFNLPPLKQTEANEDEKPAEAHISSPADYMIIAEENIFHPERKIPVEKKAEKTLPKPEFVLYGTLITDDIMIAYMEDLKAPSSTPGRGKRQIAVRKGNSLSGFTLKEIETDKVVMVRGEERLVISLNEPKTRGPVEIAASATTTAPQGVKPETQQPSTSAKPKTRTPTDTHPKRPSPSARLTPTVPAQQKTTDQTNLSTQELNSIKNAPYIPQSNTSGPKSLIGTPR